MRIRRLSIAAACAAPMLLLGAATTTLPAAASGPETDTAVLSYSAAGWSCTSFVSSNGDSGSCTATTVSLGISCLGIPALQRGGSIALVEPSGEKVQLALSVTGLDSNAIFTGSGTDGGTPVTASGTGELSCRGDMATGGTVSVTWTAG